MIFLLEKSHLPKTCLLYTSPLHAAELPRDDRWIAAVRAACRGGRLVTDQLCAAGRAGIAAQPGGDVYKRQEQPYYTFFDAANKLDWQRRVEAITALALYDTGVTPE